MRKQITGIVAGVAVVMALTVNAVAAAQAETGKPGKGSKGPLKVFILAGQSNMEGMAKIETFDYIGDDPATAPMLKEMRNADGTSRVCKNVWISMYTTNDNLTTTSGKLTAGYGGGYKPGTPGSCIGPEFTFGITVGKAYGGPILLIKTAWGGKSLNTDFRPPSAGPYEFSEAQLEGLKKAGKDIEQAKADKAKATGRYYKLMIEHVKKVLADPKRVVPDYDATAGYEIAGFAWLQGWNDMCDSGPYSGPGGYAKYSEWLADFIRDVRKDLNAPDMPFVIGVMGVGGDIKNIEQRYVKQQTDFRAAMAAPAALPEFKGRVVAVHTAPFWDEKLNAIAKKKGEIRTAEDNALWKRGASNAGYHYLGCAKTLALMGKAFAEAITGMEKK